MTGVVARSNPSGHAALQGVMSLCGGMETGELLVEMVARIPLEQVEADVWAFGVTIVQGGTYTSQEGAGWHVHTSPPSDTPPLTSLS